MPAGAGLLLDAFGSHRRGSSLPGPAVLVCIRVLSLCWVVSASCDLYSLPPPYCGRGAVERVSARVYITLQCASIQNTLLRPPRGALVAPPEPLCSV